MEREEQELDFVFASSFLFKDVSGLLLVLGLGFRGLIMPRRGFPMCLFQAVARSAEG